MAFIRGFGRYLPERVVTNAELAARLGCDTSWIENASGIEARRYAAAGETVAAMGARAAEDCLARSQVLASQVGLIISTSGSSERRFPGPGCEIAHALDIPGTPAIDLPMASAGSIFGLALAAQPANMASASMSLAARRRISCWRCSDDSRGSCAVSISYAPPASSVQREAISA